MGKQKRNRREEERLMIEEMERAMAEQEGREYIPPEKKTREARRKERHADYGDGVPQKIHCQRCKTLMENGVCPACGHRIYVPMDKKKQDKIRLIVAGVCIAVFVIIFAIGQFLK